MLLDEDVLHLLIEPLGTSTQACLALTSPRSLRLSTSCLGAHGCPSLAKPSFSILRFTETPMSAFYIVLPPQGTVEMKYSSGHTMVCSVYELGVPCLPGFSSYMSPF